MTQYDGTGVEVEKYSEIITWARELVKNNRDAIYGHLLVIDEKHTKAIDNLSDRHDADMSAFAEGANASHKKLADAITAVDVKVDKTRVEIENEIREVAGIIGAEIDNLTVSVYDEFELVYGKIQNEEDARLEKESVLESVDADLQKQIEETNGKLSTLTIQYRKHEADIPEENLGIRQHLYGGKVWEKNTLYSNGLTNENNVVLDLTPAMRPTYRPSSLGGGELALLRDVLDANAFVTGVSEYAIGVHDKLVEEVERI